MRELDSFSDEQQANRFAAFLAVQAIESTVDEDGDEWVIWVHRDEDRDRAADLLHEFRQNPDHERYENAERKVRHVLQEAERLRKQVNRRQVQLKKRWSGSWWHCYPATYILIGLCVLVSLICTDWKNIQMSDFGVPRLCNSDESVILPKLYMFGDDSWNLYRQCVIQRLLQKQAAGFEQNPQQNRGFEPPELSFLEQKEVHVRCVLEASVLIFRSGEIWRLVSPAFIHLDCLHILFNMMWLRAMGTGIEFVRGTRRFLLLCLILAVLSNVTQLLWAGPAFGGMSGVIFGMIGYVWMKGKTQPELGIGLQQQTVVYSILWLLLCMSGSLGPIANGAHLGGFIFGILIGARQAIWKKIPFTK
ncbi:MAG: rhomboid family intramembrane serine protease [Fuerstiella sp.]